MVAEHLGWVGLLQLAVVGEEVLSACKLSLIIWKSGSSHRWQTPPCLFLNRIVVPSVSETTLSLYFVRSKPAFTKHSSVSKDAEQCRCNMTCKALWLWSVCFSSGTAVPTAAQSWDKLDGQVTNFRKLKTCQVFLFLLFSFSHPWILESKKNAE